MSTTVSPQARQIADKLSWLLVVILFILPLATPIIIWKSTLIGQLDLLRIWKELLLVMCLPVFVWVAWQQPKLKNWLKTDWIPKLMLVYAIFSLLAGLNAINTGNSNAEAVIYGLIINLRFLGFFMLVTCVAGISPILKNHWQKVILVPAAIVIGFALLQYFVLPPDFLRHFGYGPNTIPFLQTIDNKIEYQRVQSTLRGANPLGAYLVLVLPLAWLVLKKWRKIVFGISGLVVLVLTHSRSAWLGLLTSVGVIGVLKSARKISIQAICLVLLVLIVAFGGALWLARDVDIVQNTVFHSDELSLSSESSNAGRVRSLQAGLEDTVHEPFGRGVGTAGPASFRNDQPARIAENYYVQLIQEVGWLGLGVFVAINYLVAKMLWQRRRDGLALVLLATFIGITAINMMSHAWTDEAISYLWWGLAALAVWPQQPADKQS